MSIDVSKLVAVAGSDTLIKVDNDPKRTYLLSSQAAYRAIAAVASRKPLLVRGEPGTGKTALAEVLAQLLDRQLVSTTVQPNTTGEDLLWSMDFTQRLADAQDKKPTDKVKRYINAGPIWWAINPASAMEVHGQGSFRPVGFRHEPDQRSAVLLIDEVEKAGIELANSLLQVMSDGMFSVPPLAKNISSPEGRTPPLLIFTSNDTRELPPAFVRRCVVLELSIGDNPQARFEQIGKARFADLDEDTVRSAARLLLNDRDDCDKNKTGMAEFIDLLTALSEIAGDDKAQQRSWLDRLAASFCKSDALPS